MGPAVRQARPRGPIAQDAKSTSRPFNCPHWVPQRAVCRGESSSSKAARRRCIGPSRGGHPVPDHARRRLPVPAFPRRSSEVVASGQPSTDPKRRPTDEASGTSVPPGRPRRARWEELSCPQQTHAPDLTGPPLPWKQDELVRDQWGARRRPAA